MKYTDEEARELLDWARLNYPIGTVFIACNGKEMTVAGDEFVILDQGQISVKTTNNNGTSTFGGYGAAIYLKERKWCKIIKKEEPSYEIY